MYWHNLVILSLKHFLTRIGRNFLLVAGVFIGTASVVVMLSLNAWTTEVVEKDIIGEFPVHRIEVKRRKLPVDEEDPAKGFQELTRRLRHDDIVELGKLPGIAKLDPVVTLFPVTVRIRPNFQIPMQGIKDAARFLRMDLPVELWGMSPGAVKGVWNGQTFDYEKDPARRPYIPMVAPKAIFELIEHLRREDQLSDLAKIMYRLIENAMQRKDMRGKSVARFVMALGGKYVVRKMIENLVNQVFAKLDMKRIPEFFDIFLNPSITEGELMPVRLVGFSDQLPNHALAVPYQYIQEFDKRRQDDGGIFSLFSRRAPLSYKEVTLVTEPARTVKVAESLTNRGYVFVSRKMEAEKLSALSDTLAVLAVVVAVLLGLLAAAAIVNGLTLSVIEQAKRIGILRAVGATRGDILLVVLTEALLIGILGAGLGLAVADQACDWMGPNLVNRLPQFQHFKPTAVLAIDWGLAWLVGAAALGLSLVAGLGPAYKAALIRPVEVLKE